MDIDGLEIIPSIYDECWSFLEGFACVKKNGKYGFINTDGKTIIPFIYDDCSSFEQRWYTNYNTAYVTINGLSFYINKQGQCVKNCENAPPNHPKAK